MISETENNIGMVKISDDVIALTAENAVLKTEGIAGLKPSLSKGLKFTNSDQGLVFDVFVVVEYGVKIPAVAWELQVNIKKEVEEILELSVKSVNIHVQGVVERENK